MWRFFFWSVVQLTVAVMVAALAILATMFLFGSCASPPAPGVVPAPRGYASEIDRLEYEASVRLMVVCPDMSPRAGSGIAVSARHVITARHVIDCDGEGPRQILARLAGGSSVLAGVERVLVGPAADAALLVAEGFAAPFRGAVGVLELDAPRIGARVCVIAGGSSPSQSLRECGYVAGVWESLIAISTRIVPGNSGAAAWDDRGRAIGIVTSGEWREGKEQYGVVLRASALAELVPSE